MATTRGTYNRNRWVIRQKRDRGEWLVQVTRLLISRRTVISRRRSKRRNRTSWMLSRSEFIQWMEGWPFHLLPRAHNDELEPTPGNSLRQTFENRVCWIHWRRNKRENEWMDIAGQSNSERRSRQNRIFCTEIVVWIQQLQGDGGIRIEGIKD